MRSLPRFLKHVAHCTGVEQENHRAHRREARGARIMASAQTEFRTETRT